MNEEKHKLKKNLKPISVWSLALGSIIGWGAFILPGNLFLKNAGPLGTAIGLIIGSLFMIIISMNYGYMVKRFPVAGGGFIFALKGFGRNHAFICGWLLGLSYLTVVPLNATALGLIGRYMFPGLLQIGYLYTVVGWEVYLGEVIFATIALVIFARTSIRGVKVSGSLQTILTFALIGSVTILTIVALFNSQTSISNLKPFFAPEIPSLKGILSIVAIAPWAYAGFDSIPQAAEEFDFPPRKALGIMICSILFGMVIYVAMNTVTAIIFPWNDFISSDPFWATGVAVEHLMGRIGLIILGVALVSAILAGILGFYMTTSRLLLSMSRSKALPEWFGVIHPEYKTPVNSIKFVLFMSLITPWFGRQVLLWIVDMAAVGAAIGYFYTSASTFNLIRKEKGNTLLKIFSMLGSILSLGFMVLLLVPGMPAYLSFESRIALIIWIALGIIFYMKSSQSYQSLSDKELDILIYNK